MSQADDAVALIDRNELIELVLAICNIDSAGPTEGPVADYVHNWLQREGFKARKVGLLPDRYNVVGTLPGTGNGCSLLFNSHMDTTVRWDQPGRLNPNADISHSAWREGDDLVGEGVVNDKGPLAAFLIAGKAVKATGVPLKGDLLLTGVIAETSCENDGPPGARMEARDLGARYLATHGGIADYAIVAEGTGLAIVSVEAGMAWFRITWISDQPGYYLPYLPDRTTMQESPNMLVRAALGVLALEEWAAGYQRRYTRQAADATIVPKAQVGAIQGGESARLVSTCQIATVYVGAFTPPGLDPLDLKQEIQDALARAGVPAREVELYFSQPGYEAQGAEPLKDALATAHRTVLGSDPPPPHTPTTSMWRDINVWNQLGVPAVTYGPRSASHTHRRALSIDSLYQAACVYARTMVDICNRDRSQKASS